MNPQLMAIAGWASWASAVLTVVGFATIVAFFQRGQPWGAINDVTSVLLMLSLIPVAFALHALYGPVAPPGELIALLVGLAGMAVAAVLQTLIVVGAVQFRQTLRTVLAAGGAVGFWLVTGGLIALASGTLPQALAWLSVVAGVGYVLVAVGFWLGGQGHPFSLVGGIATVVAYTAFSAWLGTLLLDGRLTTASTGS